MPNVQGERAVFFVSDSTGITAETLGNALLANFPGFDFRRRTIPFVVSLQVARDVVTEISGACARGAQPIVFTTTKDSAVSAVIEAAPATRIDLLRGHLTELESALGTTASEQLGQFHAVGDAERYFARMRAIEYAIEHDDGQSSRALGEADVVIIAPSRCGKTPTTMYLALQYGLLVANYPLTDDDYDTDELPRPLRGLQRKCFGLTTTPRRLNQIRQERRPDSRYASLAQCTQELRRAEALYARHAVPSLNSSNKSVEEISAVILQTLAARTLTATKESP